MYVFCYVTLNMYSFMLFFLLLYLVIYGFVILLAVPAQDFDLGDFNSGDHTKAYEAHLNAEKV